MHIDSRGIFLDGAIPASTYSLYSESSLTASNMIALTLELILDLSDRHGDLAYSGEGVNQREHALQAAALAERTAAAPALIVASLLHDLGHLIHHLGDTPSARGIDDRHQEVAADALIHLFGEAVSEPIRWHVEAKRYLCLADPDYESRLSPDSRRSLILQGGGFDAAQAARFITCAHANDAIAVRHWDDAAKRSGLRTPTLEHFVPLMRHCVR